MDASGDRTPPHERVTTIRTEVEAARERIVGTLQALRFKADVPGRLGDMVGNAVSTFTAHVLDRMTPANSDQATAEVAVTDPTRSETPSEADEGTG